MIERAFWLISWTDKALLVGAGAFPSSGRQAWLPCSQIEEIRREQVRNPLFGTAPHVAEFSGTRVHLRVPGWLLKKSNLPEEQDA